MAQDTLMARELMGLSRTKLRSALAVVLLGWIPVHQKMPLQPLCALPFLDLEKKMNSIEVFFALSFYIQSMLKERIPTMGTPCIV